MSLRNLLALAIPPTKTKGLTNNRITIQEYWVSMMWPMRTLLMVEIEGGSRPERMGESNFGKWLNIPILDEQFVRIVGLSNQKNVSLQFITNLAKIALFQITIAI